MLLWGNLNWNGLYPNAENVSIDFIIEDLSKNLLRNNPLIFHTKKQLGYQWYLNCLIFISDGYSIAADNKVETLDVNNLLFVKRLFWK